MYTSELKTNIQHHLLKNHSVDRQASIPAQVVQRGWTSLIEDIHTATAWLETKSLPERIYCIMNDVIQRPMCWCGGPAKFTRYWTGYITRCTKACYVEVVDESRSAARVNNGHAIPADLAEEFKQYSAKVDVVTNKQPLDLLEGYNKRGSLSTNPDAYHIDHIVSRYEGFMNDVPAAILGHIVNLQCIPALDNLTKSTASHITIEELYERYYRHEGI